MAPAGSQYSAQAVKKRKHDSEVFQTMPLAYVNLTFFFPTRYKNIEKALQDESDYNECENLDF